MSLEKELERNTEAVLENNTLISELIKKLGSGSLESNAKISSPVGSSTDSTSQGTATVSSTKKPAKEKAPKAETEKVEKPVEEEAQKQTPKDKAPDREDVKAALITTQNLLGKEGVKAVLSKFNAFKISDIPEKKYGAVIMACEEATSKGRV